MQQIICSVPCLLLRCTAGRPAHAPGSLPANSPTTLLPPALPPGALVDLLTKYEHTPVLVAGTLRYTIQQWDDGRLASAVLGEVAAVDPAEYERQQNASGEKAGVRSVAAFVKEMASQLPRWAGEVGLVLAWAWREPGHAAP